MPWNSHYYTSGKMASWQEGSLSHTERCSHILETGDGSDVTFIVGTAPNQERFRLHKTVLLMYSDVFHTMFCGTLPEKDEIEVPDVKPSAFKIAMEYVYKDKFLVQSIEDAVDAWYAAEKYNIAHLRKQCTNYICEKLSLRNVTALFRMPSILTTTALKSKCESIISRNASDILKSDNFLESPPEMVQYIVELEELAVKDEVDLFEFVLKWAKSRKTINQQESLRDTMDSFLPHIRFLTMTAQSFLCGPARSGIFSDGEIAKISMNLVKLGERELPSWCNRSTIRRKLPHSLRMFIISFQIFKQHKCTRPVLSKTATCKIEMISGRMAFRGISIGCRSLKKGVTLSIANGHETLLSTTCSCHLESQIVKLTLSKPITLKALTTSYKITVSSEGGYSFENCAEKPLPLYMKMQQKFEAECVVKPCKYLVAGSLRPASAQYPHIHEIFSS